jgi:poly(ADP-ribose) glycohydrolase
MKQTGSDFLLFNLLEKDTTDIVVYISKRYNDVPNGLIAIKEHVPTGKIVQYATCSEWAFDLTMLKQGENKSYFVFPRNICWLLANSFLGNVKSPLHWKMLFESRSSMAQQRLLCICDYFNRFEERPNKDDPIEIKRVHFDAWTFDNDAVIDVSRVSLHLGSMEDIGGAFVDFANRNLHIGKIIPSLTQEEVLFSMCSECFISLLIVEELLDDECIVFKNIWRHSTYSGYAESLKWTGHANLLTEIIAIDAVMHNQFTLTDRDMQKAYLGFSNADLPCISTGKWGCGVFGGDTTLKFLQQIMASQLAGKKAIWYSAFRNPKEYDEYHNLLSILELKKPTFEWLLNQMNNFMGRNFYEYICEEINSL